MSGLDLPNQLCLSAVHDDNIEVIITRNGQSLNILERWEKTYINKTVQ